LSLPLWNWFFVNPFLNLVCCYFPGKAQHHPPLSSTGGFCILLKVLSFYLCCSPSWSILLVRKPNRCSTSLIPGGVSHTFTCSLNLRDTVSPQIVLLGCLLGGDQSPLLPSKGRPIIWNWVLTSLLCGAPYWFLSLLQVPLCSWDLLSAMLGEWSPSVGSRGLLVPGGTLSQWARDA
jgi:hypothetical protein